MFSVPLLRRFTVKLDDEEDRKGNVLQKYVQCVWNSNMIHVLSTYL